MFFNSVNKEELILFRMDQQKNLAGVRNLEEYPRSYNKTFVKKEMLYCQQYWGHNDKIARENQYIKDSKLKRDLKILTLNLRPLWLYLS